MTHETYQHRDLVSFSFNEFPKFFFAKRFLLISNYHEATKHDIYIYIYIFLIPRFKPGRDIGSLEALLDRLSLRMDLPRGARHIFSMDGDRKLTLDELEDGASYVVSSYKTFKVSGKLVSIYIMLYIDDTRSD